MFARNGVVRRARGGGGGGQYRSLLLVPFDEVLVVSINGDCTAVVTGEAHEGGGG